MMTKTTDGGRNKHAMHNRIRKGGMKGLLAAAAKGIALFIIMGFALPLLFERAVTILWLLGSAALSLTITGGPAYAIARLKRERAGGSAPVSGHRWSMTVLNTLNKRWVRVCIGTLFMFIVMALVVPLLEEEKPSTAYLIISAITSPIAAITADYLDTKWKARKRS